MGRCSIIFHKEIDIERDIKENIFNYKKRYNSFKGNTGWWNSYEEAREEAIKYCLNLINDK